MSLVWLSSRIVLMTRRRLYGSSAELGSSIRIASGSMARIVAMAAMRFSPPEILWL